MVEVSEYLQSDAVGLVRAVRRLAVRKREIKRRKVPDQTRELVDNGIQDSDETLGF